MENMDLEDALGWVGCTLTIFSFIFQLIPFINIINGKINFENSPYIFISISYINNYLWMIYGEMIFSSHMKTANLIASFLCLIALIIYLSYELKKETLDSILNFSIIILASWSIYKFLVIEIGSDILVGKFCICSSIILYLYFGNVIYKVLKQKNFMIIQFNFITFYFVNCMAWLFFGIVTKDFYVIFPYAIGLILSMTQIIIYINYEKKYPNVKRYSSPTIGIKLAGKEKNKVNEKFEKGDDFKFKEKIKIKSKEKPIKIISTINKQNI